MAGWTSSSKPTSATTMLSDIMVLFQVWGYEAEVAVLPNLTFAALVANSPQGPAPAAGAPPHAIGL